MYDWGRNFRNTGAFDPYDTAGDITKKVRIDVDATTFIDWVSAIEEYVDWYDMTDERRVGFAKMKLVKLAKV